MKKDFFCLLLLAFFGPLATSFAQNTTLEDALQKDWVSLKVQTTGFSGECLQITLTNTTKSFIKVSLSPGYVFESEDTTRQDLLLVDAGEFPLAANQKRNIKLTAYCCRMHRGGPGTETAFRFAGKPNEQLAKVATYLHKNGLKASNMAQEAIWAVSDKADLSFVYDRSNKEKSKKLIEFIANLTGQKVPWYHVEAKKAAPGPQIVKREKLRLHAEWEFIIEKDDIVTFVVVDEQGKQVAEFFTKKPYKPGKYVFSFSYETNKLPKGTYSFVMTGEKSGKIEEKKVVL